MTKYEAEKDETDHGLVFTDILFGLVIGELFTQMKEWPTDWTSALHIVFTATLVLGSWIGFRRSRTRLRYHIKFFNLPLLRFALDQAMVLLYFKIATLSNRQIEMAGLAQKCLCYASTVFSLYVLWDVVGWWMRSSGKYGERGSSLLEGTKHSAAAFGFLTGLSGLSRSDFGNTYPAFWLASGTLVLIVYRWAKDARR